jgi:L-ascorbate metabolism protein UlaG (beta-lactamase superfamily)
VKIKWLGHSSFLITADGGTRIVTDPYTPGQGLTYGPISESAEVVTVSHEHGDHNDERAVRGSPQVLRGEGKWKIGGVEIRGVASFHDSEKGSQRGKNTIFCFAIDGVRVCHLGDLGQLLTDKQIGEIGPVDVLLIPVGGYYTIDAQQAGSVVASLKPRIIIPMHFKTPKANFPIAGVEAFLKLKPRVVRSPQNEMEIGKAGLPSEAEIRVLPFTQ